MRDGTYQNVGRIVECHVVGERPRAAGKHGNECRGCEEGMFHVRRHSFVRFVSRVARLSLFLTHTHTHTHTHTVGMLLLPLHVFATSQSIETRRRRPDDETSDGTNEDGGPRSAILG